MAEEGAEEVMGVGGLFQPLTSRRAVGFQILYGLQGWAQGHKMSNSWATTPSFLGKCRVRWVAMNPSSDCAKGARVDEHKAQSHTGPYSDGFRCGVRVCIRGGRLRGAVPQGGGWPAMAALPTLPTASALSPILQLLTRSGMRASNGETGVEVGRPLTVHYLPPSSPISTHVHWPTSLLWATAPCGIRDKWQRHVAPRGPQRRVCPW